MIKNILIILSPLVLLIILVSGTLKNNGSPGAKSGSPIDGATCTQCHTGSTIKEVNWITSNIPSSGWEQGETYELTLNASHESAAKLGFEITAENTIEKVGTFTITDPDKQKLVNNNKAVTQKTAGSAPSDGKIEWKVNWKAPSTDAGEITFYSAFNAANGNGGTGGDEIFTSKLKIAQAVLTTDIRPIQENTFAVYPNPAKNNVFIKSSNSINSIEIFSLNGKQIKAYKNSDSSFKKLNVSDLSAGNYIVRAYMDNSVKTQKIQIQ